MPTADEYQILEWLKQGEHDQLDFKKRVDEPAKIARTIVAFANTHGGTIVIGIDDSGEIIGVDEEQEKYILKLAADEYCEPRIKLRFKLYEMEGKEVLAVIVKKSETTEHAAIDSNGNSRVYIRKRDNSVVKSLHLVRKHDNPIPIVTENHEGLINYLKQHNSITMEEYARMMQLPLKIARRSLEALEEARILKYHAHQGKPYYSLIN